MMAPSNLKTVFTIIALVLALSGSNGTIAANDSNKSGESPGTAYRAPGAYCGVSCLYVLMKGANRDIDYTELLVRKYIGSRKGSSMAELEKAARDHGLYGVPLENLTTKDLVHSDYPIVLHVKPSLGSPEYDHYELFLGTENRGAILFDPPNPIRWIPFRELVPRWDGNGLVVSTRPIDLDAMLVPMRHRFVARAVVVVAFVLAVHLAKRQWFTPRNRSRFRSLGLSAAQGSGFVMAALFCGMLSHGATDEGLLANANAIASIQQAHLGNFIPKVCASKIRRLLGSDTVLVDARLKTDYEAGHLKGAVSVPVDANDIRRHEAMVGVPGDARIVVYCQSSKCKFAEMVAVQLVNDGFSDISIFKGGWNEWVAQMPPVKDVSG